MLCLRLFGELYRGCMFWCSRFTRNIILRPKFQSFQVVFPKCTPSQVKLWGRKLNSHSFSKLRAKLPRRIFAMGVLQICPSLPNFNQVWGLSSKLFCWNCIIWNNFRGKKKESLFFFDISSLKLYLNVEKSPFEHSLVLLVSANVFTRLEQKQHCHCAARRLRKCTKPLVCAWFPGKISSNNNFAFKNCYYKSTLFQSERNLKAEKLKSSSLKAASVL